MSVVEAVQRDLDALAERDPELARSAIGAMALSLAAQMDNPENSATSKAGCARALADTLVQLRQLATTEAQADVIDDLATRRAKRRREAAPA